LAVDTCAFLPDLADFQKLYRWVNKAMRVASLNHCQTKSAGDFKTSAKIITRQVRLLYVAN
jgi:hypothetical protein